eukprot:2473087-Heterocapsa_arctica.AAC.1
MLAPISLWSETNVDFTIILPFQTNMATPPYLPGLPSMVFYVFLAGCQTPVHPFLNAAAFQASISL